MEKERSDDPRERDVVVIEGKRYRKVETGYTLRQYFSHSTPEKGPGPGWDFRRRILDQYQVNEPAELPDERYSRLEEI